MNERCYKFHEWVWGKGVFISGRRFRGKKKKLFLHVLFMNVLYSVQEHKRRKSKKGFYMYI